MGIRSRVLIFRVLPSIVGRTLKAMPVNHAPYPFTSLLVLFLWLYSAFGWSELLAEAPLARMLPAGGIGVGALWCALGHAWGLTWGWARGRAWGRTLGHALGHALGHTLGLTFRHKLRGTWLGAGQHTLSTLLRWTDGYTRLDDRGQLSWFRGAHDSILRVGGEDGSWEGDDHRRRVDDDAGVRAGNNAGLIAGGGAGLGAFHVARSSTWLSAHSFLTGHRLAVL